MGDVATFGSVGSVFAPPESTCGAVRKKRSWRTKSAARDIGSVALLISPPDPTAHTKYFRTFERSAGLGGSSPICARWRFFIQAKKSGGKEVGRRRYFKGLGSILASLESTPSSGQNIHRRGNCADWGTPSGSQLRVPPRTYPCRRAQSDVREPTKRGRRSCGVVMTPFDETSPSGRNICTMRYFGRVAMHICPGESTWQAEKEPIAADQGDHGSSWQCGIGYLIGRVDRPNGQTTN